MKQWAKNETTTINTIYRETLQEINQDPELADAAAILPTLPSLKSSLYRKRREKLPSLPVTRSEVEFGGEWAKAMSGAEFLLGSQNDIHMFATEDNLKILAEADELYMDGTFRITPRLFYQVFTVKHGQQFPLAYSLLPGKSREVYNDCFTMLKSACQDRNLNVLPRKITVDFELGLLQAVELQFPTAKIQGCFYHYSQSIWRKVQKLGLHTTYQDDPTFKAFVSKKVALSFCPKRFVRVAWIGLKAEAPELHRIEELESYFENNGSYPINIWNYHKVDGPCTNNHVEGWHGKIKRVAGKYGTPYVTKLKTSLRYVPAMYLASLVHLLLCLEYQG